MGPFQRHAELAPITAIRSSQACCTCAFVASTSVCLEVDLFQGSSRAHQSEAFRASRMSRCTFCIHDTCMRRWRDGMSSAMRVIGQESTEQGRCLILQAEIIVVFSPPYSLRKVYACVCNRDFSTCTTLGSIKFELPIRASWDAVRHPFCIHQGRSSRMSRHWVWLQAACHKRTLLTVIDGMLLCSRLSDVTCICRYVRIMLTRILCS